MSLEFWANVSTVWLALLCFIGGLIPLVAAYFAVRGMNFVLSKSRSAMGAAKGYSSIARTKAIDISNKVAQPVIQAETKAVEFETTIRNLANDIED